jgi:putative heme-binding domain-containing protein
LFRVTYVGTESTAPAELRDGRQAELRELRHKIEAHHVGQADPKAVAFLLPHLGNADRHIRYAARVALERIPVEYWQDAVVDSGDVEVVVTGVAGLARQGEPALQAKLLAALGKLDFSKLTEMQRLELLRAYQLVLIRLGLPEDATRKALGDKFDALFPASSDFVNRELANLMVALGSPHTLTKLLPALTRERVMIAHDYGNVLSRNAGYGGAIANMEANQPDAQQVAYAFALRNVKTGWTPDQRKTYFQWFDKARTWGGGASYQKFMTHIEDDAFANATDAERLLIESNGWRKPYKAPELPKPTGPGKDYTVAELVDLSSSQRQPRNFKNGQKMFAAARCVVCHRFNSDGGATGPDLTQLAGRFNVKDLSESIVDPSKVVSDQYKTTVVQTHDGKVYTGRIVSLDDDSITLLIDPEDASKVVVVKNSNIEEQHPSPVSLMPKDLLKQLNQNEVLDLLAYLLSRGNPQDAMFKK